jgi:hypothetical protein
MNIREKKKINTKLKLVTKTGRQTDVVKIHIFCKSDQSNNNGTQEHQ